MKKITLSFCALLLITSSAIAGNPGDTQDKRGNWNPILITNKTNTNLFYEMQTFSFDNEYEIKAHRSDVYHTKYADEYVTFNVGTCKRWEENYCEHVDFHNCVNNVHYNGNLIRSIVINSLDQCTVTCLDGDTVSCRQSG